MAGWEHIGSIDSWEPAIWTYRRNISSENVIHGKIEDHTDRVIDQGKRADVIVGSPPCGSFSYMGKRLIDDERGKYPFLFLEIVKRARPRAFVMENVPGIETIAIEYEDELISVITRMQEETREMGYTCSAQSLNSADFGVPQKRIRFFLVGFRDVQAYRRFQIRTTHVEQIGFGMWIGTPMQKWVTIRDALADLEDKPHGFLPNHTIKQYDPKFMKRIRKTKVGDGLYENFRSSWFKPNPDKPAPTVLENHGGVFLHYNQGRTMTPRELARLQSFPDDFSFVGNYGHVLKQIGNAVPPLVEMGIARAVEVALDG